MSVRGAALAFALLSAFVATTASADLFPKAKFIKKMLVESPPADDGRIVPGWRMGRIHLGMDAAGVLAALGEPRTTSEFGEEGGAQHVWTDGAGADFMVEIYQGRVARIRTMREVGEKPSAYSLASGVGLGASTLEISAKVGVPKASRFLSAPPLFAQCFQNGLWLTQRGEQKRTSQIVVQVSKDLWPCKT